MPSTIIVAPTALFRKQTAELSGGIYQRGALLDPANASQYNTRAQAGAQLSMSIIQAILAALSGHMQSWATTSNAERGIVELLSTTRQGRSTLFSWDTRDPESPRYGGFTNGLTYQVVEIHLLWCLLAQRTQATAQSQEVVERWETLLKAIQRFATPSPGGWWNRPQVADACRNRSVQDQLERLADALWFSQRYLLPEKRLSREFTLIPEPEVPPSPILVETSVEGNTLFIAPQRLIVPRRSARPTRLALPYPSIAFRDKGRTNRLEQAETAWQLPDGEGWFW